MARKRAHELVSLLLSAVLIVNAVAAFPTTTTCSASRSVDGLLKLPLSYEVNHDWNLERSMPASFCFHLINHCRRCLVSAPTTKSVHARIIKLGVSENTYMANCVVGLYCRLGSLSGALQAFDEIPEKNVHSWNILLAGCFKFGDLKSARWVFSEMSVKDVVTWNSVISGYSSNGMIEIAFHTFLEMLHSGIEPSAFTFSIVVSSVVSTIRQGKQIHGYIIRRGLIVNSIVVGNSLVAMYAKFARVDCAFSVFKTMDRLDVVSWNTILSACKKHGYVACTFDLFHTMHSTGFLCDDYTVSTVMSACSQLQDLDKGKQFFAQSIKMGFLCNSIVTSAIIVMFSNCNRLEESMRLFEEIRGWESAVIDSVISSYVKHGFVDKIMCLFVTASRQNIKPTEFTIACILNTMACLVLADQGTQIHAVVIKSGMDSELVVATSIIDMYAKYGMVDSALAIFVQLNVKEDIIIWNTLIMGFARNGRENEAIRIFSEVFANSMQPDTITLGAVLLACGHVGLVNEGWSIFLSMKDKYNVTPTVQHYTFMVEMLCRAGQLTMALEVIEIIPHKNKNSAWCVLLEACRLYGDVRLSEEVAERMIEFGTWEPLPYLVLSQARAMKGDWDSVARVRRSMKQRAVNKFIGCSWIGIRNQIHSFESNMLLHLHYAGKDVEDLLNLLITEMFDMGYYPQKFSMVGDGGED